MAKNHDLSLSHWGPYGKRYSGISHVADKERGLRFDLVIMPALFRRKLDIPNANWESSYHPWHCSPGFEFFSVRHQVLWKDQVYADISFSALPEISGRLIRCELVNRTNLPRSLAVQSMLSMSFPSPWINSTEPMRRIQPLLPAHAILKHALDYDSLHFANTEPTDHLVADGGFRGEIRGHGFLDGGALGGRFGRDCGDSVTYRFELPEELRRGKLLLHGRSASASGKSRFGVLGSHSHELILRGGDLRTIEVDLGSAMEQSLEFTLVSRGGSEVEIAFLAWVPREVSKIEVVPKHWEPQPQRQETGIANSLVLKFPDAPRHYGFAWDAESSEVREVAHDELDIFFRQTIHNHVDEVLQGNGKGHFTNVYARPIPLPAGARTVLWSMVCEGSVPTVTEALRAFQNGEIDCRKEYARARSRRFLFRPSQDGRKYLFSQTRLAATVLSNIVFPAYVQRQFVKHRTGGKWWDCLYTWDAGFIGLGLLEMDVRQSEQCLAQYLTAPDNPHAAFVHHGSMVPVQITLYHELWNRTLSRETLRKHYASIRAYYAFYAGHSGGSTTGTLGSGLLKTWDYFYNSGGWDDYPAQKYVQTAGLASRTAPAITTAMAIRCAKSLALAATVLGEYDDMKFYAREIERFTEALQRYSWDANAGYYSYTLHNESGETCEILRDAAGNNFNQGLDGVFPLVAGVCSPEQERILLGHLFNERRLWTRMGLTAVDRSAPYCRNDGYWSGTVWFPHQWYFWKTMLDLGRPDLAWRIAKACLEVWRVEVGDSYHCFEHFLIETGRGAGWHQFSSLTSPLLSFFAASFCPGRITLGFDAWLVAAAFSSENSKFEGTIHFGHRPTGMRSVLLRMSPKYNYRVLRDGSPVEAEVYVPGLLGVKLSAGSEPARLEVHPHAVCHRSTVGGARQNAASVASEVTETPH